MDNESNTPDVIVIKKSWLTTAAVAVVFFIAGGLSGYFFGIFGYERGARSAPATVAEVQPDAIGQAGAQQPQQPAAPAPTPVPDRLDEVNLDDDPARGPEDAPLVIVEFSDFECPFCARFVSDTLGQIMDNYGEDVLLVYRDFPLSQIHPRAQQAAEAAECADDQDTFWEYHDVLFANQGALDVDSLIGYADELGLDVDAFGECLESGTHTDEVLADLAEGRTYGVTGTPTFFINGVRVVGAQPFPSFQQIIDQELAS